MALQLTLAARYLMGRKLRTFLTTLAIVFGVLVIFGMNIILPTMLASLQTNAMAAQGVVDMTLSHRTGEAFPQEMLGKVQSVEGVRAAAASLKRTVNLPADFYDHNSARPDAITALALVGIDPYLAKTVRTYPTLTGRYLEDGDGASALISQSLADALSVKAGDRFSLPTVNGATELTVVGILPPRLEPGNEEVQVTLPEAQALTGEPGRINTIDVTLNSTDEAERAAIAGRIEAALGPDYTSGPLLGGEEMFASLKVGQAVISLFGLLALFMGAFIIFNTFRTVVTERRHDIGMLRAVGASRGTIVGMILAEGLLQGVIGTAIGLLLGYLLGAGILAVAGPFMSQFINLKMGPPVVSPVIVIVSILLGIGVTVVAGVIPAINAGRVVPLEALRPGSDADFKRQTGRGFIAGVFMIVLAVLLLFSGNVAFVGPGGLLFLLGLVLVTPALVRPIAGIFGRLIVVIYARQGTGQLAQGNLVRQPSRAAVTASATMLGLAIVVAAGGIVTSLTGTLSEMMTKSLGSDYLFVPPSVALWGSNVGAGQGFADRLRAVQGVGDVSTMRFAASLVNGNSISLMGIDPVVFPKVAGLYFQQGNESSSYRALAQGHAIIVNGAFMATTGTKIGETIQLVTPNGNVPYRIVAMASDLLNVKITTGYISQADLQADFGKAEDVFVQLNLQPGADPDSADVQIKAIAADFPQFRIIPGKLYSRQLLAELNAAFAGMYLVLALLALPSLIAMMNTLAIGVIERTREIGMLRAVGATQKQVYTMVVAEALLLAAIGAAFGIFCGMYLGYVFVTALKPIFPLGYYFPLTGILAAIAIGLLFGALAAIIPARQAAHMNVVEALRYE